MSQNAERIDIHCHCFPEVFLKKYAAAYPDDIRLERRGESKALIALWAKVPLPAWDLEEHLKAMERDNVCLEVLSAPPVYVRMDDQNISFCRQLNEFQAEMHQNHPEKFRSFIHLPFHNLEAAKTELDLWKNDPATVGISMGSNMEGLYPGDSICGNPGQEATQTSPSCSSGVACRPISVRTTGRSSRRMQLDVGLPVLG